MQDMLVKLVDLPLARMFVLAGIIFLLVAVLGRIEGKIEPGHAGRVGASIVGVLLMAAGLAMYFIEGDELRDALHDGAAQAFSRRSPPRAAAAQLESAGADSARPAARPITVVAGSYGRNCGARAGNVTAVLARACDGRTQCSVALEAGAAEGARSGCDLDYSAEWKCGAGAAVYSAQVPAGAGPGARLTLACPGG